MRLPSPDHLWERHETLVLNVFMIALVKLQEETNLPEDEPALNELLYTLVRDSWCKLPQNEKPIWSLIPNSENPPRTTSEIGKERTRKRPDFRWTLSDSLERDPRKAIKDYTIECKRLREKSSKGWDFIKEYVVSGIIRYVSKEHNYGIGTKSGAMIGYVQNMEYEEALKQINLTIREKKEYKIPEIAFDNLKDLAGIRKANHTLRRKEISPSNFNLCHIWVDLIN